MELGLIISSLLMGLGGIWAYIYYLKKGQFEDPEDVKYQIFRSDENDKNSK